MLTEKNGHRLPFLAEGWNPTIDLTLTFGSLEVLSLPIWFPLHCGVLNAVSWSILRHKHSWHQKNILPLSHRFFWMRKHHLQPQFFAFCCTHSTALIKDQCCLTVPKIKKLFPPHFQAKAWNKRNKNIYRAIFENGGAAQSAKGSAQSGRTVCQWNIPGTGPDETPLFSARFFATNNSNNNIRVWFDSRDD